MTYLEITFWDPARIWTQGGLNSLVRHSYIPLATRTSEYWRGGRQATQYITNYVGESGINYRTWKCSKNSSFNEQQYHRFQDNTIINVIIIIDLLGDGQPSELLILPKVRKNCEEHNSEYNLACLGWHQINSDSIFCKPAKLYHQQAVCIVVAQS